MSDVWKEQWTRAINWASFLAAHGAVTLVWLGVFYIIGLALKWVGDPKLGDWFPIRYIFDAIDGGVLLVFVIFAIVEAGRLLQAERDDG